MPNIFFYLCGIILSCFFAFPANAHFGIIIPSKAVVTNSKDGNITLDIAFSHPGAGEGMDMEKPQSVQVNIDGENVDLTSFLTQSSFLNKKAWQVHYEIKKPAVYQFSVTPTPYFEPAEDSFIIHYAKVIVPAFGAEDGWGEPLGLTMEIVPLSRPFGNYTPGIFSGQVLKNGKPLPNAIVEIEALNSAANPIPPNEYYENQVIRTDSQGIFTAAIPWSGWWGFAAISQADESIELDGKKKDVEIGGVLWSYFRLPQFKK